MGIGQRARRSRPTPFGAGQANDGKPSALSKRRYKGRRPRRSVALQPQVRKGLATPVGAKDLRLQGAAAATNRCDSSSIYVFGCQVYYNCRRGAGRVWSVVDSR